MQAFHRGARVGLVLVASIGMAAVAGCDGVFGLTRVHSAEDQPNAYLCGCTCFAGTRDEVSRAFEVCVPSGLNPNLGGTTPTTAQLGADCNGRVRDVFTGILAQCGSNQVKRMLETDPTACRCEVSFAPTFVEVCNGVCMSTPLSGCSNQTTATSVGSLPPVCSAEATSPRTIGRVLFGDRSICEVDGTLSVVRGDDDPVTDGASGVVEIAGQPCPGASCAVGVTYRLTNDDELEFDSFAGFASVSFSGIHASGGSLSSSTLDTAGDGAFGASQLASSGRGTREDEIVFGTISDSDTASYVGANTEPVDLGVEWAAGRCSLVGTLIGAQIDDESTDIAVDMLGTLVDQPPRANAGADRHVECTSPAGATFDLTAAASTDPDGDIRFRDWWITSAGGTAISDPERDGVVSVSQALGATTTYVLGITDSHLAISQDAIAVRVVDTTAPTISALSASPASLFPLNHALVPVRVSVTAQDTCGTASCSITSVTSNQPIDDLGDGDTEVDWIITGALTVQLRAESSAVRRNRVYTIAVTCSDGSGNGSTRTVAVTVPVNR